MVYHLTQLVRSLIMFPKTGHRSAFTAFSASHKTLRHVPHALGAQRLLKKSSERRKHMTHRLYYDDSYISEFDAQTVSCTETDRGFEVVLNRSAFYPGGGGQPCDTGYIGGVRVSEAFVRGDDIVHIADAPVSGNVRCEIDF